MLHGTRFGWAYLASGALVSCLFLGCQRSAPPSSILFIVADTLRADALGVYGASGNPSPELDRLASGNLLFERAYSVTSWTQPTIAAILSGRPPLTYQPGEKLYVSPNDPTLAEQLRARGYSTAAFVANPVMAPELGFERGFATYRGFGEWQRGPGPPRFDKARAGEVSSEALAWLKQQPRDRPWFLYVHYMDPHWPYIPELQHASKFWKGDLPTPEAIEGINIQIRERTYTRAILALARDLYRGAVAELDASIGVLLREAEKHAPTGLVVVVVSDHGEEFGDHGDVLHARTLFEEMLHVPLILRTPDRRRGQIPTPVQVTGIASTVWETAGLGTSPFPAPNLLSARGQEGPLRAELFRFPPAVHHAAIIDANWKLILALDGNFLLYRLDTDPKETQNLATTEVATIQRLQSHLGQPSPPASRATISNEDRERLRALGYDFQ